ncbi:GNAT family N-acetyltransferase [Sphingomonas glacialis]|uniref:N-acetyltransferase n=1 Tax=Sphingomonas glacialis TaxID=658225 RepID=A0A502FZR1_9SPHN|nr:GNAT family protein [Sphingomonas glacialis]TPG54861.1 N-acetyltransferase [Sphingomonas glacialis]
MRSVPVLETARLRLRERTPDDADALFPIFADVDAMTYWSTAPHDSVEQTRAELTKPPERDATWRAWAITLTDDDRAIGFVWVGEKRIDVCEIGYMLAREHWGCGIAREAVRAVLDQLFRVERQRRVFADTDPDNTPSNALLATLGFQREGLLRAEWETHIGIRDTVLWGLLASEWTDR